MSVVLNATSNTLCIYVFIKIVSVEELWVFLGEHKVCLCVKGWLIELKTLSQSCSRTALHLNLQFITNKILLTRFLKTNYHRREPLNFILYTGISVSCHKYYRNEMFWQCLSCAYYFHELRTCYKIHFWSWDEMHEYVYMKSIYEST